MAQIILTIDDAKLAAFRTDYLKAFPIPLDRQGNPKFTFSEWIKKHANEYLNARRLEGASVTHQEGFVPPANDAT